MYDGHGGSACAEFLRDHLHHYVVNEACFPENPKDAILIGFKKAENKFLSMCYTKDENGQNIIVEKSGSCATVVLIVGETCYTANVGDSRAVLSMNGGEKVVDLSDDHKPSETKEYLRIINAGGQVYQTTTTTVNPSQNGVENKPDQIIGPIRVLPGRLSVSIFILNFKGLSYFWRSRSKA